MRTQSIVCATVDSQCLEYLGYITLPSLSTFNPIATGNEVISDPTSYYSS